ncbi:MAG TPA: hypothetical protein VLG11_01035 [Candidatus Saccharimonadales bacterium]|nr:hypothetical protein [Candidatus Saccharimonadales bacterium]
MTRHVQDANGTWQVVASNLPAVPSAADPRGATTLFHGRYRGAHNTGVPDKSALGLPEFPPVFNVPNVTYSDRHFVGYCQIDATGIVFERCFFEARGDLFGINANQPVTLYDCDIYGGKYLDNSDAVTGSVHAVRCNIWGGGNDNVGFGEDCVYEDCYIHFIYQHYGTHSDNSQILGNNNLGIKRCKLLSYDPYTGVQYNSCLQISSTGGLVDNVQIVDNYMDGGGYTINGRANNGLYSNMLISGNRFGRHYAYGPVAGEVRVTPPAGTFTNTNVYDDTGITV